MPWGMSGLTYCHSCSSHTDVLSCTFPVLSRHTRLGSLANMLSLSFSRLSDSLMGESCVSDPLLKLQSHLLSVLSLDNMLCYIICSRSLCIAGILNPFAFYPNPKEPCVLCLTKHWYLKSVKGFRQQQMGTWKRRNSSWTKIYGLILKDMCLFNCFLFQDYYLCSWSKLLFSLKKQALQALQCWPWLVLHSGNLMPICIHSVYKVMITWLSWGEKME